MTVLILPRISFAQCGFCTGGVPATKIVQVVPVGPTNVSTTNVVFNKYYDSKGDSALSCFYFEDTITAVSKSYAHNGDPDTVVYTFNTDVNYSIKGPSGSTLVSEDSAILYGPDTLAGNGHHGDSVVNGPDTFFNKKASHSTKTGNPTPYTGSAGPIDITITFGGGAIAHGGSTYDYTIKTTYSGVFKLTYYICPSAVLATSIRDLTATQNGNSILLQWLTDNEQNNTTYEIQVSTDGKQFSSAGQAQSDPATAGATTKHQYQYNTDQINVGKLYFRIKQTDANGKVTYSVILIVSPGGSGDEATSFQIYPNPAANSLIFQFNSNQTGRYLLELVSTAGQVVQQKSVTLTGTSQIRLDLNPQPAKGLYFMRTKDLTHNQSYVSKVLIN
jgi:hypothetical protein